MNGNGLARRLDRLEEQFPPDDLDDWAAAAIPIIEAMLGVADDDWNAPGGWFDLQSQLWEVTGSPTWRAVDARFDAYIAREEARQS